MTIATKHGRHVLPYSFSVRQVGIMYWVPNFMFYDVSEQGEVDCTWIKVATLEEVLGYTSLPRSDYSVFSHPHLQSILYSELGFAYNYADIVGGGLVTAISSPIMLVGKIIVTGNRMYQKPKQGETNVIRTIMDREVPGFKRREGVVEIVKYSA